jgi:hypothetical protein
VKERTIMRLLIAAALVSTCAGPALPSDMALMVGLRSTMAASIRDYGYRCRDVTSFESVGYAGDGEVLKVFCAAGTGAAPETRTYKVVAYMDGEFEALPWPRENATQP